MKVDSVNSSFKVQPSLKGGALKQPSFSGGMTSMQREIMNTLPHRAAIERMKSMEWLKGEIGGILLTALGTGLVAPIFIGYNPFVKPPKNATPEQKEDIKNTKLYTAMRQPISAGLAILFQASVQKYIDRGLDKVFHNPKMSGLAGLTHDLQEFEQKSVIEERVAEQIEKAGYKKPSLIRSWFSKEARAQRKAYEEAFEAGVDAINDQKIEELTTYLEENGKIRIGKRHLDSETFTQIINKQIDEYIKDAESLKKTDKEIARYVERAELLINNEDHLRELFKDIPVEETYATTDEKVLKPLYKRTENILRDLVKKEPKDSPVQVILKEILELPEDLRADKVRRTFNRIKKIREMCGDAGFTPDNYEEALILRNNILEEKKVKLLRAKIKDPSKLNEHTLHSILGKVIEICGVKEGNVVHDILRDTSTFGIKGDKLKRKIYKDVVKGYKDLIDKHALSMSQFTKIAVGVLVTLPITCTALNWIYPRFMDLFFPNLSGAKKDKKEEDDPQTRAVQMTGGDK